MIVQDDNSSVHHYPHYGHTVPNGRYVNQLTYQNSWTPPTPAVTVPPPPPTRAGTHSNGSLTAESGEVGNSWGGHSYHRNNN